MSSISRLSQDLKGTWGQAFFSFFLPVLMVLVLRWAVVEPFVIPSGSMLPTLKIHDHLLVRKFSFGLKWPFGNDFIWMWSTPQRGDIVVFKYPKNPRVFYIKRVIGIPGDRIEIRGHRIVINGQKLQYAPVNSEMTNEGTEDLNYDFYEEDVLGARHLVRYLKRGAEQNTLEFQDEHDAQALSDQEFVVPKGSFFVLGDNRDESSDSRIWGFVEARELVGKPWIILMGCSKTLQSAQFCHPQFLNRDRFFKVP